MKIAFWGATGTYFKITDKAKVKLKNLIIEFLESHIKPEKYKHIFQIKADDGFGMVATDACREFVESHKEIECVFHFVWINKETYDAFSKETKGYYGDIVHSLESKGLDEKGHPIYVAELCRNISLEKMNSYERRNMLINFSIDIDSNMTYLLTYKNKECLKDNYLRRILDWFDVPYKLKKIIDLYAASNSIYEKNDFVGVRKQKNSSRYYYRIKMKLPDGTPVNIEKGAFENAAQASEARRKHLIALTTQDCDDVNRTFDDVFNEFVSVHCKGKPALEKKYITYYNSRIKDKLGSLNVGKTEYQLGNLQTFLTKYEVKDKRTKETCRRLSKEYVLGMRAMLNNFYDYAYKKKYIHSHPMYALPAEWGSKNNEAGKKEKNNFIQPLFAYSGNKHKLLPSIKKIFPKEFDVFVDLFGGSGAVGVNTEAKKIIVNDEDLFLIGIYKGIQNTQPKEAWKLIESIIEKYALKQDNEQGYYTCRDDYNKITYEERCRNYWYWGLVLVWSSFNRSTVQFNQQLEYNAPFGFNKVNFDLAKRKFFDFANKIQSNDRITFACGDYASIVILEGSFVYLDPPYLITTASYNKGWSEDEEKRLYVYLEKLDNAGIKWAMSNVLQSNGKEHMMLLELIKQKKYHVHYLDNEYEHASFRRKNKGKTVEVLITNY